MAMPVKTSLYLISLLLLCLSSIAGAANGEPVYRQNCMVCHGEGVAGAPRVGDVEAWKERLSKGIDAMVTIVIEGVQGYSGAMPPRGGNPNLSDEQIRGAVQYMLDQLQ
jgi:cytochrome c5